MTDDEMLRELAESGEPWAEPLRGEHEWWYWDDGSTCSNCYETREPGDEAPITLYGNGADAKSPYCLRHDLEAVVRAAAAMGCWVRIIGPDENHEHWAVKLNGGLWVPERNGWQGYGPTPVSAAIRALYAAKGG